MNLQVHPASAKPNPFNSVMHSLAAIFDCE